MKKDGFYAERIRPVVVMAVLTIICISIVSGIHLSTQDLVIANEGLMLKKAVLYAGGIELPGSNAEINALYDQRVEEDGELFRISGPGGMIESWAFLINGPGLWGEIEMVAAFNSDFSRFTGVEFTKQNETPGLGARITEDWFKQQLRGKRFPLTMAAEGMSAPADDQIDSITGATRTSGYVLQLFNEAGKRASEYEKEVR